VHDHSRGTTRCVGGAAPLPSSLQRSKTAVSSTPALKQAAYLDTQSVTPLDPDSAPSSDLSSVRRTAD